MKLDFSKIDNKTIPFGFSNEDRDENNRPNGCNYYKTKYGKYAVDFIQPNSEYVFLTFDEGYELQIRSRSGRSIKEGLIVLNAPGTIDPGYRDEIKIIVMNLGSEPVEIYQGDRIAQMVLNKVEFIKWCEVEILEGENRGGGFGSTGNK